MSSETAPVKFPQKRFFRQRAHANPFSDHSLEYPVAPSQAFWDSQYPEESELAGKPVTIVDVGCGYGGFLVALSKMFPQERSVGLEIRTKLVEYVKQRLEALQATGVAKNAAILRTNAMKFLPNFFQRAQLKKMFILFPDPHFKRKKHKARIITPQLLTEYAYFLASDAELYVATDVAELFEYMVSTITAHPLFKRVADEDIPEDIKKNILFSTEESMKVDRKGGSKNLACFKRV